MRRIRAAISVIASHEVTRWIHANEIKLSRARKQPLRFTAAAEQTFAIEQGEERTASRRDAEFFDQPLHQRLDIGPRGIFLSQNKKVTFASFELAIEQLDERALRKSVVAEP